MRTRNFQEVYDFCKSDATYRVYHDLPEWPSEYPSRKKYEYYHRRFAPNDLTRAGSYIYVQSERQLDRFLGVKLGNDSVYAKALFTEKGLVAVEDFPDDSRLDRLHISMNVRGGKGYQIQFSNPFLPYGDVYFYARSHRPANKEGMVQEVLAYCDKHLFLAPGRYRDLQLKYRIPKERFVSWYKRYKEQLHDAFESEHYAMLEKYEKKNYMDYDECRMLLAATGILYDVTSDEYEQEELVEEFYRMANCV